MNYDDSLRNDISKYQDFGDFGSKKALQFYGTPKVKEILAPQPQLPCSPLTEMAG